MSPHTAADEQHWPISILYRAMVNNYACNIV